MAEFGEQLRRIREEKGMTQQSLADKIYVTRQTVSRWESGNRYPDLVTAKKLANLLEVSLDSLLSEMEIKSDIGREMVLDKKTDNGIQIVLYSITACIFGFLFVFSIYDIFTISESLAQTPAGRVGLGRIVVILSHFMKMTVAGIGLFLSLRKKMLPKVVGIIMSMPYFIDGVRFGIQFMDMQGKNKVYTMDWITGFGLPLLFAGCVLLFFIKYTTNFSYYCVMGIGLATLITVAYGYYGIIKIGEDVSFVVGTVHMVGKVGFIFLLEYQAFRYRKKSMKGCR